MHEVSNNMECSVYSLLTLLCRNIAYQNGLDEFNGLEVAIPKLRAAAYEILLKKTNNVIDCISVEGDVPFDALRALDEHLFVTKLHAKARGGDASELEEKIDSLLSICGSYFKTKKGNSILQLLLVLQNNTQYCEDEVVMQGPRDLLVPGAFTLHAPFQNNRYYPKKCMNLSRNFEPKYFQSLQKMKTNVQKGFLPQSFPKNVRKLLQAPIGSHTHIKSVAQSSDDSDCTFTGMTRRHICSDVNWLRIDMRSLQFAIQNSADFYALQMSVVSCKPLRLFEKAFVPAIEDTTKKEKLLVSKEIIEPRRTSSWSWDQIGSKKGLQCPKPFVSDVNIPFQLQNLACQERNQHFEAKVLMKEQFLQDLKLLTVGLQSDTFHHNEEFIFNMLPNITIENVLPITMENYVREFLDCGTCYKCLQVMTSRTDYKNNYDGFIFKACRAAVCEYLLTFRQFVFSYKGEETLISFYKRMKRSMALIQNLSFTLSKNPRVESETRLPKGSQFLGYLYREIMRLTDNEYITLLMFLLKRCCHVYFKYLQLWIFHGILDDPLKELFILYVDHYRKNTKYFYDKAYIVRKESVPGFFQNYEDRILQCGKYTMLLKAYNANHPLFDLEYPKIAVRLSFEEIQNLESNCIKYAEKAREVCGKPVTVKDIFEARNKRRNNFQQMVFQRSRENMERWNLEQREILKNIAEEKRKRLEELTTQLEEAKQCRIEKRRQSVEIELKALREAKKLNEERLKRENINLRKRIEYYQELSNTLEAGNAENDTVSSTSSRKTRRLSLTIEGEGVTRASDTPTTTPYSSSTMSLKTFVGNENNDISQCRDGVSVSITSQFEKKTHQINTYSEERSREYGNNNHSLDTMSAKVSDGKSADHSLDTRMAINKLQRSISDVINSNILHEDFINTPISDMDNLTPLQINRLNTLTGTIGLCFGNNHRSSVLLDSLNKKSEELRVTFENDITPKKAFSNTLTELDLNKQKVLTVGHVLKPDYKRDTYRKSLPDVNLNIMPENVKSQSELERNRKRMMEGLGLFANYPISKEKSKNTPQLTDLERNRRKVLTEEYAVNVDRKEEPELGSLPYIDIRMLSDEMLTDMQRNRRRMMESPHPFTEYNKPPLSDRPKLNLNLDTDRARNRRKVLESEYNILTGDIVSSRDILTPMSTTSDPPITEQLSEVSDHKSDKSDIVNGNLRLSIPVMNQTVDGKFEYHENCKEPSTAASQPPFTPFDALNSAGIRARTGNGFEFEQSETTNQDERSFLNLTDDCNDLNSAIDEFHYDSPYKWCQQLVESKFQCPTRSTAFRINVDTSKKVQMSSKAHTIQNFKIDSLSVITLTEFLQKSVIMPMNTHMELVNGEVMRVLLQDLHLIDHFRSLRHYFFLMDGEFGSIICDGIIGRVESGEIPIKVLSYQMLHMILDTALSYSIQKDSNAENLSFIVSDIPLKFELNSPSVLGVLSLSYRVQWPLNLILNPETLEQYGNIFKYLLKVRRISWILEKSFELLRQAAKKHGKRLLCSPQYLRIQQIRHKFYHFVHTLQHHITATALQASWKLFKDELIHSKSLEDIYRLHTQYVKRIMFLCMLNRSSTEFNNAIENIFKISLKFYNNLKSREFLQHDNAKEFIHPRFKKIISEEEEFDKLIKYTIYLGNKIVRRGYQAEIGEFITLININKYYTSHNIFDYSSRGSIKGDAS